MSREDPLEKEMATHSSILAGKHSVDRGAWRALSPWGHKELDMTEQLNSTELNGLVVFSTFFNLSLNLAMRSS